MTNFEANEDISINLNLKRVLPKMRVGDTITWKSGVAYRRQDARKNSGYIWGVV